MIPKLFAGNTSIEGEHPMFDYIFKIIIAKVSFEKFKGGMTEPKQLLCFERNDSVAAVVHDIKNGKVWITEQFRYPTLKKTRGWLREIPAGSLSAGEDPTGAITRELREEIGYEAQLPQLIGCFYLSPGGSSERIWLYYVAVTPGDEVGEGGGLDEEGEDIRRIGVPILEAFRMLDDGEFIDAKTIIGLNWLRRMVWTDKIQITPREIPAAAEAPNWAVLTSDQVSAGIHPDVVLAGACNIRTYQGLTRNPGRDALGEWLTKQGIPFFEVQIHPKTHGREYDWDKDGEPEKLARKAAKVRVYQIIPEVISVVTAMEIMNDHNCGRRSIVWFPQGKNFAPMGLGTRDDIKNDPVLKDNLNPLLHGHLWEYANSGRQIRNELKAMLSGSPFITFIEGDEAEVEKEILRVLHEESANPKE